MAGDDSILFATRDLRARVLARDEIPALQAFFDANPHYFQAVNGRPANPDEAAVEFDELPPTHLTFENRWVLGLFDHSDALAGVLIVLSDLGAPGVWHIALMIVATDLHGSGASRATYEACEAWMVAGGARWIRLGVIAGNARGERFWERNGYVEVRQRTGFDTGGRINDVRVLVKPIGDATVAGYLDMVPRDRPDSTLP